MTTPGGFRIGGEPGESEIAEDAFSHTIFVPVFVSFLPISLYADIGLYGRPQARYNRALAQLARDVRFYGNAVKVISSGCSMAWSLALPVPPGAIVYKQAPH